MQFRKDINGLRAIAVTSVVLYHFELRGFAGGFAGVDVFFVISGYLMTQIIFSRMATARFSLLDFYLDRVRRIVPALAVLTAVLLLIGWFLLPPADYRILGRHSASALTFLSNILFYKEAGYFDLDSHEKWLLHTWSLSVEWQFYLLYPVIILTLAPFFSPKGVRIALALLAVLSLVLCLLVTPHDNSAAFYLLPTRAWEMLVGGIVYLFPVDIARNMRTRQFVQLAGLVTILAGIWLMDPTAPWPGWRALIPVLGTALAIGSACPNLGALDNAFVQWIGKTSYSIYLWHWPTVVALGFFEVADQVVWRVAGIFLSAMLGGVSFHLVEQTTGNIGRGKRSGPAPRMAVLAALTKIVAATLPVASLACFVWRTDGFPSRVPLSVRTMERETPSDFSLRRTCFNEGDITKPCLLGGKPGKVGMVLLGDSQALVMAPLVREAMTAESDGALYFRAYPGCATVIGGGDPADTGCLTFNTTYLQRLFSDPFIGIPVVIVNSWQGAFVSARMTFTEPSDGKLVPFSPTEYRQRATNTICLIAQKHPTFVVGPLPDWDRDVAPIVARRLMRKLDAADISQTLANHLARHRDAIALMKDFQNACKVTILDPAPYLCPNGTCSGTDTGHPLYFDPRHLNDKGAQRLVPMFTRAFETVARN